MSALSEYLRGVLRRSGLGQNEFAEAAGTTPGTMSRWLKAEMAPELDQLVTLSESLAARGIDVPLDRLIELRIGRQISASPDPSDRARRIALLAEAIPDFQEYAEGFLSLDPHEQDAVLTFLEMMRSRRRGGDR